MSVHIFVSIRFAITVAPFAAVCVSPSRLHAQWLGHGGDPQHSAISSVATQPFETIRWSTTVDESAPAEPILIHYGSPAITRANTVLIPVRADGGQYCMDARNGSDGSLLWEAMSDFINAPSTGGWVPNFSPTLTPSGELYFQGIGGTVYRVDDPDSGSAAPMPINFLPDYAANKAAYDGSVFISTPLTSDASGNVYFGYEATTSAPGGLQSGIVRIASDGTTSFTTANAASGVSGVTGLRLGTNSAPALSLDDSLLYVGLNGSTNDYLAAIDSATLAPQHHVALAGTINDSATSSPTIGPDGDVYFGVLPGYHRRGALQHFSFDLAQTHTEGSFGWDETVSIVPASLVPSYTGGSSYLLFSKYNDYKQAGGTGVNRLAILDPNATQIDPITGEPVMREVLTIAGVTPDPELPFVREWCINTAAVDPFTHSIVVNSEDGMLYRWDLWTNTFTEEIELVSTGVFEAYTPTVVGPDGTTYAINRSTLFAVGVPEPGSAVLFMVGAIMLGQWRRRRGEKFAVEETKLIHRAIEASRSGSSTDRVSHHPSDSGFRFALWLPIARRAPVRFGRRSTLADY